MRELELEELERLRLIIEDFRKGWEEETGFVLTVEEAFDLLGLFP